VSEKEVRNVVSWFMEHQKEPLPKSLTQQELMQELKEAQESPSTKFEEFLGGEDPLYEEAKKVVIQSGKASASLLQRRLRIGYARAARLLDLMEEQGVVGPADGAKPREVYKDNMEA
jgi:S-DNA-T family DNA segregation ATPase FtsK/SpoIIIE